MDAAIQEIYKELEERVAFFEKEGKLIEAQRIKQRTMYDVEMMQELGYCSGIENYSRVIEGRPGGLPAPTPCWTTSPRTFVLFIDESHVTLPQVRAMYNGDRARKTTLVDYGFRLPCAFDNRPLKFEEFEKRLNQVVYVSATPGEYERTRSGQIVEQVIRPTGLLDPRIEVRPVEGQIDDLIGEINARTARKGAGAGHHPHQEDGGGPHRLPAEQRHQGALYAPRHGHHGAHGDHPGPAPGYLRRAGGHQPAAGGPGPAGGVPGGHSGRGQGGLPAQETSLIQTIGRAARNAEGMVVMYADTITPSMRRAMDETERRRESRTPSTRSHGIVPKTVIKSVIARSPGGESPKRAGEGNERSCKNAGV